ncbi:amidohydrolase family protein [Luteimonas sp. A649]
MHKRLLALLLVLAAPLAQAQHAATFDMHVHLREGEASLLEYEAALEAAGVGPTRLGAMWFGGPRQALEGDLEAIRAGNDSVIALAVKYPEVLPIATVHPYDGRAAQEELTRVAAQGVKVLKIHPHTQKFNAADPRVLELVRNAGELGMTVLMDNAGILPGDSETLFNLAVQAQGTRLVFAHMGGMDFRFWNILALARTADGFFMDNVHFDISGIVLLAAGSPIEAEFVWTLRNVGIDKVLLGSDYPQMSLAKHLEALERLPLTPEEKAKIRSDNARRLFGLD